MNLRDGQVCPICPKCRASKGPDFALSPVNEQIAGAAQDGVRSLTLQDRRFGPIGPCIGRCLDVDRTACCVGVE